MRKKDKIGMIVDLVPQRKNFLSDKLFQQVMNEYIFHCLRFIRGVYLVAIFLCVLFDCPALMDTPHWSYAQYDDVAMH